MKTLMLLRHAKSDWDDRSLSDFDRPLADRGNRDAPRMGKALSKRGPLPDIIISSPAARARQTIEAVVKSAGLDDVSPQFEESIYGSAPGDLMILILRLPDSSKCALLVAHNPTFEQMVARLSVAQEHMPTASLACIEFQVDHGTELEAAQGKFVSSCTPIHSGS